MHKRLIIGLTMFCGFCTAQAATVDLTNGGSVQGDIIKKDSKSLALSVDGVTMTYYSDEIKDIDGQPFDAAAVTPQAPSNPSPVNAAPVAVPEAVNPEASPAADNTSATGTIDPKKRALILKFVDVFGTRQALINNFNMMTDQIAKEKPDEAQKIRDRVKIDEIIERLLPIYDRNFSSDDLRAFIAFYGSDEGKKLITTIPILMKESVAESVKYMEEKFPEVKQGQ